MNALEEWKTDNKELIEEYQIPDIVIERIFNGGVLSERDHILALIQEGVLRLEEHPNRDTPQAPQS